MMKVITPNKLDSLKRSIKDFFAALVQSSNWHDEKRIADLLVSYKLRGSDISHNYSIPFTKSE